MCSRAAIGEHFRVSVRDSSTLLGTCCPRRALVVVAGPARGPAHANMQPPWEIQGGPRCLLRDLAASVRRRLASPSCGRARSEGPMQTTVGLVRRPSSQSLRLCGGRPARASARRSRRCCSAARAPTSGVRAGATLISNERIGNQRTQPWLFLPAIFSVNDDVDASEGTGSRRRCCVPRPSDASRRTR